MIRKPKAVSVLAVAVIGVAGAGMSAVASAAPVTPHLQPVVSGAPLPLAPAADLPSAGQLISVLNGLQDPNVPFASKGNLVEGGVGGTEARIADRKLQKAARDGDLPLSFNVANIQPAGPGTVSADVTASGPKLAPTTQNITFVNQDGYKISRGSALSLLQAVQAG